jgi:hypothetical protein
MPRKSANPSKKLPWPSQVAREKALAERRAAKAAEHAKQEAALVVDAQLRAALRAAEAVEKTAGEAKELAAAALRAVQEAELQRRSAVLGAFKADRLRQQEEKANRFAERERRDKARQERALVESMRPRRPYRRKRSAPPSDKPQHSIVAPRGRSAQR